MMQPRSALRAVAMLLIAAPPSVAQSLARRAADVRDGAVQFTFAARPGVCGDGATFIKDGFGDDSRIFEGGNFSGRSRRGDWPPCMDGPVRVVASMSGGEVVRLRTFAGPPRDPVGRDARDLGTVSVQEAVSFLSGIIQQSRGRVGGDAVVPLVLADSVTPWPTLIGLARNDQLSRATRSTISFWLSRGASARLGLFNRGDDEDDDVRASAVFALSQQPKNVAVPELIELARHSPHPAARGQALFWLGQSGDPRAIDVFEEILGRR
jgi:HEAT repeat protein